MNVKHISDLYLNLVSAKKKKLENAGCNVNFDGGKIKVSRSSLCG